MENHPVSNGGVFYCSPGWGRKNASKIPELRDVIESWLVEDENNSVNAMKTRMRATEVLRVPCGHYVTWWIYTLPFSLFLSFSLNTDEHLVDQCAFAVCYSSTVPMFLKLGEWQHNHETRGRIRDEILMHQNQQIQGKRN